MKRTPAGSIWLSGITLALLTMCALVWPVAGAHAQGVTTGSITGVVNDAQKLPVPGATVTALHEPSGTTYESVTQGDGRFSIPGMRVGGPYTVTASLTGFQSHVAKDVVVSLGIGTDLTMTLGAVAAAEEVTVIAELSTVFSSTRTGAATAISRDLLSSLPTVSNQLSDVLRLTPQSAGMQFAGQDNRMNNITVDGSYFNNSFGLAGTPGERTGVAPISLSAVEAVQVNIAPYDVRQGNFIGAGVNTVTRSGANQFRGSAYYQFRDENFVGTKPGKLSYNPGTFDFGNLGFWGSGPIVKNKAFFFVSFEDESNTYPGTTYTANPGGAPVAGNMTRVLASDLNTLSSFLKDKFSYDTGPYQDYGFGTPARRFLAKVDYNLNNSNKLSVRYNRLRSSTDVLESNSSSLGYGTRRSNTTGLNFQNSNYQILENIDSFIGEMNSVIGTNKSNTFIAGYTYQDESRGYVGEMFPLVDILEGSSVYTSFGFEPFTPNNELRYGTFQLQDNFSWFRNKHTFAFGVSAERYESENVYFPGAQSVYVYNSLADFYTDANDYLANPNRTTSPITLRRFQVRWNNIPGQEKPIQPLEVWYIGGYAQDDWQVNNNLKLTYGLRLDVPVFGDTAYANANADALTFRDETGGSVKYSTGKLPDSNVLWSPRLGFNWALDEDRRTQLRGGTGIFTGKPAYVWVSNQVGNTGVLTGFERLDNTKVRPFNPDIDAYKPANVTGAPASSYELALTDPAFKFPQIWRNSLAIDQKLPGGWTGTAEFLYSRDVNGIYYINANLPAPNTAFAGADTRPRWTTGIKLNPTVDNAIVLKNQDVGSSWTVSGTIEKNFKMGLWLKAAYNYREAKNTVDPGSVAFGSWNNNQHPGDPNNPGVGISNRGHRVYVAATYRFDYLKFGATSVSVFFDAYNQGSVSYTYSGDLNGDGGTSNDLIYIPRDTSEMNFRTLTSGGRTYTPAEQAAAWEAYIQQDKYLSKHRGEYAKRGGALLPFVARADMSITQDLYKDLWGRRNDVQFRVDILNVGNLLNHNWGTGQRLINAQPLTVSSSALADSLGRAQYQLRVVNNELMTTSLERTAGLSDVWRLQFSIRYTFN